MRPAGTVLIMHGGTTTHITQILDSLCWPASRLGEALATLARQSSLSPQMLVAPNPPQRLALEGGEELEKWLEAAAYGLGLEAVPVETPYGEVERFVRRAAPALLRLPGTGTSRFLALLDGQRHGAAILGPDLMIHRLRLDIVCALLRHESEAPLTPEVDRWLDTVKLPRRRQERVRTAILGAQLSSVRIGGCWRLRLLPGASFWQQVRRARLPQALMVVGGAHAMQYALWLLAWWVVGQGALAGRLDRGWLLAWGLLLLTQLPFRLLGTWVQGELAISGGGLLKQRLLYGALRLEPEEVRHQGTGQLLGRVLEAETVEALALSGGFLGAVAGIELAMAAVVLSAGAGGGLHACLLLGWVALTCLLGWQYLWRRRHWTAKRLGMTHDLVERLVGHRTRLAQESRPCWHTGEDQVVEHYLEVSAALDQAAVWLMALVPRGWLVLGLAGLAPAFLAARGTPARLAVGLGGMLLAYQALRKLAAGSWHLAGAAIGWQQVAPLFQAASRVEPGGASPLDLASAPGISGGRKAPVVLEAHDLVFRYRNRGEPVLCGCSLQVCVGDRLLLEGPTGGGKSTLASLLTGLRQPESGLLLLGGLDHHSLGLRAWRRRVVAAPQFHENYVVTGTFAFNLLMGRRWPPRPEDFEVARQVCHELGLEELLERMPAGLLQMVGETGWQLSHGERSRLYIARALLQGADCIVLDESFAALDPTTLHRALHCVLNRAPTLLVVAHP